MTSKRQKLVLLTTTMASLSSSLIQTSIGKLTNTNIISTIVPPSLPSILIGTHDGSFHCDEALAISILKLLPKYSDATILRTRNPELLSQCHMVVDVGAKYEPESNRYDHHQREFTGVLDGYHTKLSSAGLIYKHFGRDIIREILKASNEGSSSDKECVEEEFVEICYQSMYKNFMEHIDAIDNGISVCDTGHVKYHISTTLSSRVGTLNPAWNEEQTTELSNSRFIQAMIMTCTEFVSHTLSLYNVWWPARSIVKNAIDNRFTYHESGKIVVLDQYCPWSDHLFDIETLLDINQSIYYVIYGDTSGSHRIQAVAIEPKSFTSRKKLPEEWLGLRDDVLSEKCSIPGCIFIHAGGFIGGNKSKEGAIAMAIKAIAM